MNEIRIIDKASILGKDIQVIEGGFGEYQKAITDKMIAEIHEVEAKEIRKSINRNLKRFKEGIDYINLKGGNDFTTLESFGYSKQAITQADKLFLLSERGYSKIIKIMDSDKAWEVHDELMDNYFNMRKIVNSPLNNQSDLFTQLMTASMTAISQVLDENIRNFKDEIKREMVDTRNIITEQEVKHEEQLKQTRELIGFRAKNTMSISMLLKTKISDIKGYTIRANEDFHYQLAKQRILIKYKARKWEDIPVSKYSEVHADIDSIEDLEFIIFE